jgi:hypothetical protein
MPRKALAHRKKKINSTVVDILDLAENRAGAFEVCLLLNSSLFSMCFSLIYSSAQSSKLIGWSVQTNVADSDRGPVLEPIQEVLEPKRIENLDDNIFTSLVEQSGTDVLDALVNQPQRSANRADL